MMRRVMETPPVTGVPAVYPSALIDQNGYLTGSNKIVVFRTAQDHDTFEVRDTKDDTSVYTGSIRKNDGGTWFGEFGSFQTTGSYYIYTETTGSSYAFFIDDAVVFRLKNNALQQMEALLEENKADATVLSVLLLAYELNPDAYDDAGEGADSGNGIPDILDEARKIAESITRADAPTREEEIATACALAHFSGVYAPFDRAQADAALTTAKSAWDHAAAQGALNNRPDAFAAAGALYRMTGEKTFENILSAWFRQESFAEQFRSDKQIFYGAVQYLFSRQPVNVAVRNTIHELLAGEAGRIADRAEKSPYFVSEQETQALLDDMMVLCTANHFNYNHGYSGILENHLHYLSGRNPQAVNYLGTETERTYLDSGETGIPEDARLLAKLVLLLGAS